MAHFVLPSAEVGRKPTAVSGEGYFGDQAIRALLRHFKRNGTNPSDLVVTLAGGATVLGGVRNQVGAANVDCARKLTEQFGIALRSESVLGTQGLRVRFDTATGEIFVKRLSSSGNSEARARVSHQQTGSRAAAPKRVLIIDDSKVIRQLFRKIISSHSEFEIFGDANDPIEAEELMRGGQPDLITLDMQMPRMDGLTYLRTKLAQRNIPVVMVSGAGREEGDLALRALECGAVDFVAKPAASEMQHFAPTLIDKLLAASHSRNKAATDKAITRVADAAIAYDPTKIIVIGSSTGGTVALSKILAAMPPHIPPIVIVQHIPPMFSGLFAERLNSICPFAVKEAGPHETIMSDQVLIAPGDKHVVLKKADNKFFCVHSDQPPVNRHKPSVDVLFEAAARVAGKRCVAAILTGMGKDGAQGMLAIKEAGGQTFAQDEESSVVFGMPKEAIKLGGAEKILPLHEFPAALINACRPHRDKKVA